MILILFFFVNVLFHLPVLLCQHIDKHALSIDIRCFLWTSK